MTRIRTPFPALLALCLAASRVAAAPLVVRNGGMTQGLSIPAQWSGKSGECEASRDTTTFKEAPASLCVSVAGGKSGMAFQSFEAKGGESFKLAGWVKSAGKVKVNVAVQSFDEKVTKNNFDQMKFVQDQTEWTAFEKEVTLPPWAAHFNILLLVEGEGKAWLDEVHEAGSEVDPGEPTDPLVSEPAPKGKPWEPGWGFYPVAPKAWQAFHEGFVARTKQGANKQDVDHNIDVVFLGDSITLGWVDPKGGKDVWDKTYAPLKAVDYGAGGDGTRQILWRLGHGELDGLSPKLVVLMIGTNNLYGDQNAGTDEEIARGVAAVVAAVREKSPETRVLVAGILPRQNEYFCGRIDKINAITRKLDDGKAVRYLDMKGQFLESPGKVKADLYNPDQLHLSAKGYEVWSKAMGPLLDEMLKR